MAVLRDLDDEFMAKAEMHSLSYFCDVGFLQ